MSYPREGSDSGRPGTRFIVVIMIRIVGSRLVSGIHGRWRVAGCVERESRRFLIDGYPWVMNVIF